MSLSSQRNLVEIASPRFPSERLVATERELDKVVAAGRAGRLKSKDAIGLRVGKIVGRYKVGKHFRLEIADNHSWKDQR